MKEEAEAAETGRLFKEKLADNTTLSFLLFKTCVCQDVTSCSLSLSFLS